MNPFRPTSSLLDDQVTLATFDAWSRAAYRASGRNHQGLLAPHVVSGWHEGCKDHPLLGVVNQELEWPGNVPAEVYCAHAAFNYLGTFTNMHLASALGNWPYDAVDLTALRLGAEVSQSDMFASHVDKLIAALRFRFEDVCHDIKGSDRMRVLGELDDEALEMAKDGSLEKALSDWAVSSGKLIVNGDAALAYRSALAMSTKLQRTRQDGDTEQSQEDIRKLEGYLTSAAGHAVRLANRVSWVTAAYHFPAPPPLVLAKYNRWELRGERIEVVLAPSALTGDGTEAWLYRDGSEYSLPSLRVPIDAKLFARLS